MNKEEIGVYILQHFEYHPDGTISRDDRNGVTSVNFDKDGYARIKVKGKHIRRSHISWLLNNGRFPISEIDHINRVRDDDRIENLRESNRIQQIENRNLLPNKDTGYIGIYEDKSTKSLKKKFTFQFQGKSYRFYTPEEAFIYKQELKRRSGLYDNL